jgi:hypothetical protein
VKMKGKAWQAKIMRSRQARMPTEIAGFFGKATPIPSANPATESRRVESRDRSKQPDVKSKLANRISRSENGGCQIRLKKARLTGAAEPRINIARHGRNESTNHESNESHESRAEPADERAAGQRQSRQ